VALQAEQVDVANSQQVHVGAAMRNMTRQATFDFYGFMFENEWSLFVGMTGKADGILRGRSAHLLWTNGAVRIVAIGALDQAFGNAMVKRHLELCLLLQMAGVAELRLYFGKQEFLGCGVVWRMAGDATYIVRCVNRIDGIHVLRAAGVAIHAAGVDFLGGGVLEGENFGDVAIGIDMRLARTVASFAALPFGTFLGLERREEVGRRFKTPEEAFRGHVCMAGFAGVGADIV
jgi:hypothetical protein